jgi:hypothetical protein
VPALLPSTPPGVCASANDVPQIKAATAAVVNNLFLISRLLLSLCPSLLEFKIHSLPRPARPCTPRLTRRARECSMSRLLFRCSGVEFHAFRKKVQKKL